MANDIQYVTVDSDNEWLKIDSKIIRAHEHSGGALKKYGGYGRTRARKVKGGGFVASISVEMRE